VRAFRHQVWYYPQSCIHCNCWQPFKLWFFFNFVFHGNILVQSILFREIYGLQQQQRQLLNESQKHPLSPFCTLESQNTWVKSQLLDKSAHTHTRTHSHTHAHTHTHTHTHTNTHKRDRLHGTWCPFSCVLSLNLFLVNFQLLLLL